MIVLQGWLIMVEFGLDTSALITWIAAEPEFTDKYLIYYMYTWQGMMMLFDAGRYLVAAWLEAQQVITLLQDTGDILTESGEQIDTLYINWSDIVMFSLTSLFAFVAPVFKWMFYYTSFKAEFDQYGYDVATIILDSIKLVI